MGVFEVEANGKVFEVEGPDLATVVRTMRGTAGEHAFGMSQQRGEPETYQPSTEEMLWDVAKAAPAALARGASRLPGLVGDARAGVDWLIDKGDAYAREKLGMAPRDEASKKKIEQARSEAPNLHPTSAQTQAAVEGVTGPLYQAQHTPGKYAQSVGEMLPMAVAFPGRLATNVGIGVTSGLGSEAAGQATEGTAAEPYARVAGALAGPSVASAGRRLVTPFPATAGARDAAAVLDAEGVRMTARAAHRQQGAAIHRSRDRRHRAARDGAAGRTVHRSGVPAHRTAGRDQRHASRGQRCFQNPRHAVRHPCGTQYNPANRVQAGGHRHDRDGH